MESVDIEKTIKRIGCNKCLSELSTHHENSIDTFHFRQILMHGSLGRLQVPAVGSDAGEALQGGRGERRREAQERSPQRRRLPLDHIRLSLPRPLVALRLTLE